MKRIFFLILAITTRPMAGMFSWSNTTPEQAERIWVKTMEHVQKKLAAQKNGWGELLDGYQVWKQKQGPKIVEEKMRNCDLEMYSDVFWYGNIDMVSEFIALSPKTTNFAHGLFISARQGHAHIVEFLLKRGVSYKEKFWHFDEELNAMEVARLRATWNIQIYGPVLEKFH